MADIVIKGKDGADVTYTDVETVSFNTPEEGVKTTFTHGVAVENVEIELDFSEGNQTVNAEDGQFIKSAVVKKPETLVEENIIDGVEIAGVTGKHKDEMKCYFDGDNGRTWSIMEYVPSYFFYDNRTLTSEVFPKASFIGSSAFWDANLTGIEAPKCTNIQSYAFCNNQKLKYISFPECETLENYAFSACYGLKSVDFPKCTIVNTGAFRTCKSIETVSLPVCSLISDVAFGQCSLLSLMYAPQCSSLGSSAFYNCSNLCDIWLGAATITSSMVLSIATYKTLSISGSLSFAQSVFASKSMYNLVLHGFKTINTDAFRQCNLLKQVDNKVVVVWTREFYSCKNLKRFISPKLARIGSSAFAYCSSLAYFSGYAVSYISNYAFYNCSNLSVIMFMSYRSLTASILSSAFANTPITNSSYLGYYGSIYVPEEYLASYLADSYWAAYSSRFTTITSEIEVLCQWEDL